MSERPFGGGMEAAPIVEAPKVKTRNIAEGQSMIAEGEGKFTAAEIISALKELEPQAGDVAVTDQIVNHEGTLLSMSLRARESATGYSYTLKCTYENGKGGNAGSTRTLLSRSDYAGPNSDELTWEEEIAFCKNGVWQKS